jgi:dihydrofolate synthase/folylpolyglutamate synthase
MRFATLQEWLHWQETLHPRKIDLGLERIGAVLDRLGLRPPPFRLITVGGTNGKGSSVALLSTILQAAGMRVGTFTSPHLVRYNERICVQGEQIGDQALVECFHSIDTARGEISLTYFEFCTLAAVVYFARRRCDVAVLEVGLGGRLDSVNALDADAAMVVNVGIDHSNWLGDTREAIGLEKAGIFRAGRPAVVADREPPGTLLAYAADIGAAPIWLGEHFDWRESDRGWHYLGPTRSWLDLPRPALAGQFQLDNAAGVLALLETLPTDWRIPLRAVRRGLRSVRLPGRLQLLYQDEIEWLLDVAHNEPGASQLARELRRLPFPGRTWAVFAAMADKDLAGMIAPLQEIIHEWIVCPLDSPRAATPDVLKTHLENAGAVVRVASGVADACAQVARLARPGDRVLLFGSFYTVGPALEALGIYSPQLTQVG